MPAAPLSPEELLRHEPRPKRALPPRPPADAAYRLTDCHRLLVRELGEEAPALVTMKRHAASGLLNRAVAQAAEGRRTTYLYRAVLEIYAAQALATRTATTNAATRAPGPKASAPQAAGAGAAPAPDLSQLEPMLRRIVAESLNQALAPLRTQVERAADQAAGLAAVRTSLMLKYDSAHAAAVNQAEMAQTQLRDARRGVDLEASLRQVQSNVARLAQEVQRLSGLVEERRED